MRLGVSYTTTVLAYNGPFEFLFRSNNGNDNKPTPRTFSFDELKEQDDGDRIVEEAEVRAAAQKKYQESHALTANNPNLGKVLFSS